VISFLWARSVCPDEGSLAFGLREKRCRLLITTPHTLASDCPQEAPLHNCCCSCTDGCGVGGCGFANRIVQVQIEGWASTSTHGEGVLVRHDSSLVLLTKHYFRLDIQAWHFLVRWSELWVVHESLGRLQSNSFALGLSTIIRKSHLLEVVTVGVEDSVFTDLIWCPCPHRRGSAPAGARCIARCRITVTPNIAHSHSQMPGDTHMWNGCLGLFR
jgi:hypothetical protein